MIIWTLLSLLACKDKGNTDSAHDVATPYGSCDGAEDSMVFVFNGVLCPTRWNTVWGFDLDEHNQRLMTTGAAICGPRRLAALWHRPCPQRPYPCPRSDRSRCARNAHSNRH